MLGIGRSNTPLIPMLVKHGAQVTVRDRRTRAQLGQIAGELEQMGARLALGGGYLDGLEAFDILFRTPGIRYTLPQIDAARARGVAVTSEMETFFAVCPCPIIGVTGSDGKTTTTTLIAEMLRRAGRSVHLGGNIGRALLPEIETVAPGDVAVVELSSFQLISMRRSPDVAVITNISPNHLDMHKDMREYIDAKRNILWHQNGFGRAVLNFDNEITNGLRQDVRGQLLGFSSRPVAFGCCLDKNDDLLMCADGKTQRVINAGDILIPGRHNVENYMAAIAAVWGMVPVDVIADVARTFPGVEHRIELVRERGGVRYYNDSIATTPTRTMAGLRAFSQKVLLIAGGYDKKIPFDVLGPAITEHVKTLVLLGVTADKIEAAVRQAPGFDPAALEIVRVDSLGAAVNACASRAKAGDVVLLSPACASFDMFPDFETRGEQFKELVRALD